MLNGAFNPWGPSKAPATSLHSLNAHRRAEGKFWVGSILAASTEKWGHGGQPWKISHVSCKAPSELKAYVIMTTFQHCGFGFGFFQWGASLWWVLLATNLELGTRSRWSLTSSICSRSCRALRTTKMRLQGEMFPLPSKAMSDSC